MTRMEPMDELRTRIRFLAVDMQKMGMNTNGLKVIKCSSGPITCPPERNRRQVSVVKGGQYTQPNIKIKDDALTDEFRSFLARERGGKSAGNEATK